MRIVAIFATILLALTLVCTGLGVVHGDRPLTPRALNASAAVTFQLSSPTFLCGAVVPLTYTCDGANRAPALQWKGAPSGTRSFVLIMDDPDAPGGTFTHWMVFNIPGTVDQLPEGVRPRGGNLGAE